MTLAEWLALRKIVLDPATVQAQWRGRNEIDFCLSLHERCAAGECPETCSGQIPFPAVEPDGTLLDRWNHCPRLRAKLQAARQAKLLKRAEVPPSLRAKRFEDFTPTPGTVDAYEAALAVAHDPAHQGLVLAGGPGVGKTHLAAAIMATRIAAGHEVLFATVPELIEDLRGLQRDQGKLEEMHKLLTRCELLVLDDLGAERGTKAERGADFGGEQLFLIVNGRMNWQKPLVVTTNLVTPHDLGERLGRATGPRIVSRLAELCAWHVLEGPDTRLKPKGGAGAQQVML